MTNPDRARILDLSATEEARGPHPNDYFVCLTPREASAFLAAAAFEMNNLVCLDDGCANCEAWRKLWWSVYDELPNLVKLELETYLASIDVMAPARPWREVR